MSNQKLDQFTIETLLSFMAKLQQMKKAAKDASFQPKTDARFTGIVIKIDDLLARLQRLVAPVMLAEVEALNALADDLYKFFKEKENSPIAEKGDGNGH